MPWQGLLTIIFTVGYLGGLLRGIRDPTILLPQYVVRSFLLGWPQIYQGKRTVWQASMSKSQHLVDIAIVLL